MHRRSADLNAPAVLRPRVRVSNPAVQGSACGTIASSSSIRSGLLKDAGSSLVFFGRGELCRRLNLFILPKCSDLNYKWDVEKANKVLRRSEAKWPHAERALTLRLPSAPCLIIFAVFAFGKSLFQTTLRAPRHFNERSTITRGGKKTPTLERHRGGSYKRVTRSASRSPGSTMFGMDNIACSKRFRKKTSAWTATCTLTHTSKLR